MYSTKEVKPGPGHQPGRCSIKDDSCFVEQLFQEWSDGEPYYSWVCQSGVLFFCKPMGQDVLCMYRVCLYEYSYKHLLVIFP